MDELTEKVQQAVRDSTVSYCKFITPNDVGQTGGHQSGFHIHKNAFNIAFDTPGLKGENLDKFVKIKWQDDFEIESRFIYYGTRTRNEYRLTRFGRDFPFLKDEDIGNLLILCRKSDDYYQGFVLSSDTQIEDFLNEFGISPANANGIIQKIGEASPSMESEFENYVRTLDLTRFPSTKTLADAARSIFDRCNGRSDASARKDPDGELVHWVTTEYSLFKKIEDTEYTRNATSPIENVERLVTVANSILNRRKSRAGKSLEHHLAHILDLNQIKYTHQAVTEGNNTADFIMPSQHDYHETTFPENKLVFLGAKTTCKDRWRQVLSEADRIPHKHLFTLQQGVSSNQLEEMKRSNLTLVVPSSHISAFPPSHREDILVLKDFIGFVKEKQM